MGQIISIVNRKGGVGKTTLTLGLADTLISEQKYKASDPMVLVVDLDPQGSLTRALLYDRNEGAPQAKLREVFDKRQTFGELLKERLEGSNRSWNEFLRHGVGPVGQHYSMLANNGHVWDVERDAIKKQARGDYQERHPRSGSAIKCSPVASRSTSALAFC